MNITALNPRQALNKAFLRAKPSRIEIDHFKTQLKQLLERTNDTESEKFHKNLLADFLKKTYYDPQHFINTKGRNDLVIHTGKNADSAVGVILEAKKPTNTSEMPTTHNLNSKAFQELLLYYLRERISLKNLEVKHLIISNIYEWFIFDVSVFERLFAQNKSLVNQFEDFENGRLADTKTSFFYQEIAAPLLLELQTEIELTYFNLQDYQNFLFNADKADDKQLISLFKVLSPEHLLKLPFANDSNTLNKGFYTELLHIMGLTEIKSGSKKLIGRNKEGERNSGSLLEDAMIQLDSLDKISRINKPHLFGKNHQERLFNVALELCITWINRILFLKLLEAQLISYHKGDKAYAFLSLTMLKNYNALNSLFFQVLAKNYDDRNSDVKQPFEKVPYLNSSLFEPTELEQVTLFISNLQDTKTLPIFAQTILKDTHGKKLSGQMHTFDYLLRFLDAYDFGSEGEEVIQEDNKPLINASVLGLIFEKINGYQDGSFFTPGFITMYMSRETLRKAVVQKFKDYCVQQNWQTVEIDSIDDIYELIPHKISKIKANEIINSLKICDPAVGSGHFLVSVLNEIIAIKAELMILLDKNGKSLHRYKITAENDELMIAYEEEGFFKYFYPNNGEVQRVQEGLFHEKQTLIENCLFGVDINPNSVKICRLRLWIELLKHAYYKSRTELETLPNIDINIKCGNSLVSRFAIDADLGQALKKKKWTIESYRLAVDSYRNAKNREHKREMENLIGDIKSDFRTEISANDPKVKKLQNLKNELFQMANQIQLFEMSKKEKADWDKKTQKKTAEIEKLSVEIEAIKENKMFENAFEWRFEFPEVLNDNGDFIGFDVVIGNPPYINAIDLKKMLSESEYFFYKNIFETAKGAVDLYIYFFELGYIILRKNYFLNYITPNRFLSASYGKALRELILNKTSLLTIGDFSNVTVFKEASTYPITTLFQKNEKNHSVRSFTFINEKEPLVFRSYKTENLFSLNEYILGFVLGDKYEIVRKVISQSESLSNCGVINATSTAKEADNFNSIINETNGFKLVNTGTIDKYSTSWGKSYLIDQKRQYLKPYLPKSEAELGKNRFELYSNPKIIFAKIAITPEAFYDEKGEYASINTNCIHSFSVDYIPEYILGWVNSKLFQYIFECFFDGLKMSGGYLLYSAPNLLNTYIKRATILEQKTISGIVKQVVKAKKQKNTVNTCNLEKKIDHLVYQLYDLTEEEIKIIENA